MFAPAPLPPGVTLDRFEVLSAIKAGGMGAVYVARDRDTGERVALKVMLGGSSATVERFEREGRLAARLAHPRIVAARAFGSSREGTPWIAMELLRGEDLEARLARGALAVTEALELGRQVCEALAHAHARGVVHRDLKPSNVFLCEGTALDARVLDFGVALVAEERQLTRTGGPIGTPAYMSPEQVRGERGIDARADVWALGVMLYECLAGRRPFHAGSAVGTLYQIVSGAPADLLALRPDTPRALAELIAAALRKSRHERPPSADAFREALAGITADARDAQAPAVDASTRATAPTQCPEETTEELRLSSVVCVAGARDGGFVTRVAAGLRARVEVLASGVVVALFGVDRWTGDEPRRALRFAHAVAPSCEGVGVATGRVLRGSTMIAGEAIDRAAEAASGGGLRVDEATAAFREVGLVESARESSPAHEGPFVGRELELAALLRATRDALETCALVPAVVLGAAGLGKSRLRREALARAQTAHGALHVITLRCDDAHRETPFGALREALGRDVAPAVAEALALPAEGTRDPTAALDGVRSSLRTALEGIASEAPLVLAVDDAQWLDASSRAALRWVREQRPDLPIALWVFGRPEAVDVAADVAGPVPVHTLAPLEPPHAAALLRAVAGEAPEALVERASGHPLLLEAIGALWRERGSGDVTLPLTVEGAQLAQLDQLTAGEREFLKRAAVLGRVWWTDAVAHLGGDPEAIAPLRAAGLVAPRPRSRFAGAREFAFRVGLLQEVAARLLPDPQRRRLHARAAEWLSARAAPPDELARHWELGGEAPRAAAAWVAAARAAAAVADVPTACVHAARALALTDDPALRWQALASRDDALQVAGDHGLQGEGLRALDELAPQLGPAHEAEAAWRRSYFHRLTDEPDALADATRAVALADLHGDAASRARARIETAMLLADAGRSDEAAAHADLARTFADRAGDAWLSARAEATVAYARMAHADPAETLELFHDAALGFARAGDARRAALMHNNAASAMLQLGRLAEAAAAFDAALVSSRRVGNAQTAAVAAHNLGVILRLRREFDGARAAQREAAREAARLGFARLASFVATERVWIALAAGDDDDLLSLAEAAVRAAEASRAPALLDSARAVSIRARARRGLVRAEELAEARAQGSPSLELALALWEAGRLREDADVARAAFEAACARVRDPHDREASRGVLGRRLLVADALFEG